MQMHDDDLTRFEAAGAPALPGDGTQGSVENEGARIWYASYGTGQAVILLHGGLGHSGNWGYQVPTLRDAGYRVVVVDSRGHGRSTRDSRPYSYELMASDVRAMMAREGIARGAIVGWSDGACTGLVLASQAPERVAGVFFFGCNMDPSGTKEISWPNPILERCLRRHREDYARLSATPGEFDSFSAAVGVMMKTQPNYTMHDLEQIRVPVAIVQSEHDEFIRPEHAQYLARTIPGAEFIELPAVSHFAPLQRPEEFNRVLLEFLGEVLPVPRG